MKPPTLVVDETDDRALDLAGMSHSDDPLLQRGVRIANGLLGVWSSDFRSRGQRLDLRNYTMLVGVNEAGPVNGSPVVGVAAGEGMIYKGPGYEAAIQPHEVLLPSMRATTVHHDDMVALADKLEEKARMPPNPQDGPLVAITTTKGCRHFRMLVADLSRGGTA